MSKQTLYLMLGYPGAGKTTAAQIIHELTGAVHLWTDKERLTRYGEPTYSHEENLDIYSILNQETAQLLSLGESVIFDTSFNYYKDRERLRDIAFSHNADCVVVWVTTHKPIAKERAIQNAHLQKTRIQGNMSLDVFERISNNLEPPLRHETFVELDGTQLTPEYVARRLGLDNESTKS